MPGSTLLGFSKFEPRQNKANKMACAPSEDSYQSGHPPNLVWVFAVSIKKASQWVHSKDSDQTLNLRWVHMPFVGFVMRWPIFIGIKHVFSCINIRQVPWEVLKTEAEGRGFQHLPRDLANVNALKNHVRSLLLHKNWKYLLHFVLFLALFCFAFSPMSRERYFHGLCSFWGRAVHI